MEKPLNFSSTAELLFWPSGLPAQLRLHLWVPFRRTWRWRCYQILTRALWKVRIPVRTQRNPSLSRALPTPLASKSGGADRGVCEFWLQYTGPGSTCMLLNQTRIRAWHVSVSVLDSHPAALHVMQLVPLKHGIIYGTAGKCSLGTVEQDLVNSLHLLPFSPQCLV